MLAPLDVRKLLSDYTFEPCGSRVTCDPSPFGSDFDYLVVIPDKRVCVAEVVSGLLLLGFECEGDAEYQGAGGDFMSWRRGDVNLIVTADVDFAAKHRVATALCKRLNLMNKPDRIAVFQAVLYANAKWI